MSFQDELKSVQEVVDSLTEDERKTMLVFEFMTSKQMTAFPGAARAMGTVTGLWRKAATTEQNEKLNQCLEKLANHFKKIEGN